MCYACGALGHISRYCHNRPRRHLNREDQPHPGTTEWCHALGLHNDRGLIERIRHTLKSSPGATIYLNDECIYRGVQEFFYREELPKGVDLAERARCPRVERGGFRRGRARSRSPSRERVFKRERSPLKTYMTIREKQVKEMAAGVGVDVNGGRQVSNGLRIGEERGNWRRPETQTMAPAPVPVVKMKVPVVVLPTAPRGKENVRPRHGDGSSYTRPIEIIDDGPGSGSSHAMPIEIVDLEASSIPRVKAKLVLQGRAVLAPLGPRRGNAPRRVNTAVQAMPERTVVIEDPHFVLGVSEGASAAE